MNSLKELHSDLVPVVLRYVSLEACLDRGDTELPTLVMHFYPPTPTLLDGFYMKALDSKDCKVAHWVFLMWANFCGLTNLHWYRFMELAISRGMVHLTELILEDIEDSISEKDKEGVLQELANVSARTHICSIKWLGSKIDLQTRARFIFGMACECGNLSTAKWIAENLDIDQEGAVHGFVLACSQGSFLVASWVKNKWDVDHHANNDDAFRSATTFKRDLIARWLWELGESPRMREILERCNVESQYIIARRL